MRDLLRRRRSVRAFETRPVAPALRRRLEDALLLAPSSRGMRPCAFVFVDDPDALRALARAKERGAAFLARAPLAVAVLGREDVSDVWIEDGSVAASFLLLAAQDAGLGACWIQIRNRRTAEGLPSEDAVRALLGFEKPWRVLALVALGHPAEAPPPRDPDDLPRESLSSFPPAAGAGR